MKTCYLPDDFLDTHATREVQIATSIDKRAKLDIDRCYRHSAIGVALAAVLMQAPPIEHGEA